MSIAHWGVYTVFFIMQSAALILLWLVYHHPFTIISAKNELPPKEIRREHTAAAHTFRPHPMVDEKWEEEVKRTIEYQCLSIRNAVFKQTIDIHQREIELAPKQFLFDRDTLVSIYSQDEIAIIDHFIEAFQTYLNEYWYTKDGQLKTVFPGRISNVHSEAGKVVHRSKYLSHELDQLLEQLRFTLKY